MQSVVVKGLERNIVNLYEARRLLLGLDSSEVSVTTKNLSDVSVTTKTPVDPLVANNGITSYWLNLLMQQLCLTETGVCVRVCVLCMCQWFMSAIILFNFTDACLLC